MTTGYGFAIPATDIVDGILVEIEKSRSNGAVFDLQVQLTNDGTSLIGENKAVGSAWSPSDGYVEYGGNTDNWGRAWTAIEINSPSFGVGINVWGANFGSIGARIDHITITVYHHSSIMPITLSSFEAMVTNTNTIRLDWTTTSEINNDSFTVEKSVDGESYTPVGNIKGSGNTSTLRHYEYEDRQPYAGRNYYRLKQTDFDGTYTYSKVVKADYNGPVNPVLVLIPSPTMGHELRFRVLGISRTGPIHLTLYDLQGRILDQQKYDVKHPGVFEDKLVLPSPLSAGLYIVKAGPGLQMTRKLVVR